MTENEPIDSMEEPQRAGDIARRLVGIAPKKKGLSKLEKILLTGSIFAAATWGTIEVLRPSQYDRIKKLHVAEYVVKPGDTYWTLSERFIQDKDEFEKRTITSAVMDMNSGKDPAKLRPGTTIMLPVDGMPPEQVTALGGYLGESR